jgi:ABC-2 type transport system ATP-binding protein
MTSAVACHGLVKRFGETVAVDSIDLVVEEGEIFGLLGPNGAGKTTTIRMITTLAIPDAGTVEVFGRDCVRNPMAARRTIGYMPQQLSAEAALTGRENVSLFARLYDVPRLERKQRVDESLDAMGLTDAADRIAGTYSGGMIRRLELAQALVGDPRLLVLDEPTIGLDPVAREGVWDRILELRRVTDMTVLITTHYMDEADFACDRVALMNRGQIVEIGTPTGLKQRLGEEATLDDVFRHHTGSVVDEGGDVRDVASVRRTAHRLG